MISLGMFGTLLYIACKASVINDMTHEIRDILFVLDMKKEKK